MVKNDAVTGKPHQSRQLSVMGPGDASPVGSRSWATRSSRPIWCGSPTIVAHDQHEATGTHLALPCPDVRTDLADWEVAFSPPARYSIGELSIRVRDILLGS